MQYSYPGKLGGDIIPAHLNLWTTDGTFPPHRSILWLPLYTRRMGYSSFSMNTTKNGNRKDSLGTATTISTIERISNGAICKQVSTVLW